jgi:NADPH2:quinone reductase
MRAVAFTEFGSAPEVLELDPPQPDEGELRVRLHAASVNGFDLAVAGGYLNGMMEHRFPVVLGKDFAGTVDAIGPGVTEFVVGDRVFGVVTKPHLGDGSFGEYVTVPAAVGIARLPESVGFTEAAALGLAGTAALATVDGAKIEPGHTVLVVGATGGVGNQVVQLAANAGAKVIATAHTDEEKALVQKLGAVEVVDHTADVTATVRESYPDGVDAVVHLAGDGAELVSLVRDGGRFVSTLVSAPDQLPSSDVKVVPVYANPTADTLSRLAEHQATGTTRVTIQRVYGLDDAPAALSDFARGTLGKLVITTA